MLLAKHKYVFCGRDSIAFNVSTGGMYKKHVLRVNRLVYLLVFVRGKKILQNLYLDEFHPSKTSEIMLICCHHVRLHDV
jgi:hypothetical protein